MVAAPFGPERRRKHQRPGSAGQRGRIRDVGEFIVLSHLFDLLLSCELVRACATATYLAGPQSGEFVSPLVKPLSATPTTARRRAPAGQSG